MGSTGEARRGGFTLVGGRTPKRGLAGFSIVVSENGLVDSAVVVAGGSNLHVDEARQIEMARVFKPWMRDGIPVRVRVHDTVRLLPPERWAQVMVPFPDRWEL